MFELVWMRLFTSARRHLLIFMVIRYDMEANGRPPHTRESQKYSFNMACEYATVPPFRSSSDLILQLRIVNAFRFCCRTQRPKVPVTWEHLFQPLITTNHAPIMEIDFNLHSLLFIDFLQHFLLTSIYRNKLFVLLRYRYRSYSPRLHAILRRD